MTAGKMHTDELDIDEPLVRRLLEAQFPQWAHLPLAPVARAGTTHAIFRLGSDKAVRLPLRPGGGTEQMETELHWLPKLAPHLPLTVPAPLARGEPSEHYPLHWTVYGWIEGEPARPGQLSDSLRAAEDLARFVNALRRIDPAGGPTPGPHNSGRGVPLATRDAATRRAIAELDGWFDVEELSAAWETDMRAPRWDGKPTWIHGDLLPGNVLVRDGRIHAVIDFGCLAVGDPACDLMAAWTLLPAPARPTFRANVDADDASWARGRAWALSFALIALPYYRETNTALAETAQHTIEQVLDEHASLA